MARIVTVYHDELRRRPLEEMSHIRWHRISRALARREHRVDLATGDLRTRLRGRPIELGDGLRRVPITRVRWDDYDVVKTLFHRGFRTLEKHGGAGHPFLIAKLGSVVDARDREGIPFHGAWRERLFRDQRRIAARARYVTVVSQPARDLWRDLFPGRGRVLVVPGAADADLPPVGDDPYPDDGTGPRCLFAGSFYGSGRKSQPEAHRKLVAKLNGLGERLRAAGLRLYVLGPGEHANLDRSVVEYLGTVSHDVSWDYLRHADVGVVVAAERFLHNNESTKIYHYLRSGLPVVTESGFPNEDVVREASGGLVAPNGDLDALARRVAEAAARSWDRESLAAFARTRHSWDRRAAIYEDVLERAGAVR